MKNPKYSLAPPSCRFCTCAGSLRLWRASVGMQINHSADRLYAVHAGFASLELCAADLLPRMDLSNTGERDVWSS